MTSTATIPTAASRAFEIARRAIMDHPFSEPLLGTTRYSRLTAGHKRLIALLDIQHREEGVTVFGLRNACKVVGLNSDEIVATLDELNRAKMIFFVSFEIPSTATGVPWVFYAVKPFRQPGDMSLKVAHRIATRLIREGRA